jgi:hypothetical protein
LRVNVAGERQGGGVGEQQGGEKLSACGVPGGRSHALPAQEEPSDRPCLLPGAYVVQNGAVSIVSVDTKRISRAGLRGGGDRRRSRLGSRDLGFLS